MKLIAKKPCSFGGERFYIGDEIPVARVLNPRAQEKMGVLAIVPDDVGAPALVVDPAEPVSDVAMIPVLIHAEEGDLPLNLTQEGIQAVVDVLTSNVDDAEPVIEAMTDGDALILLHAIDGRKGVKTAAEARAQALNGDSEESAGEQ